MRKSEKVEFPGSLGETLTARLDLPDFEPRGFALFAHCFTCSKDTKGAAYLARALTDVGIGVLRFDFTGLGGSGGEFGNTSFTSNVDDLLAATAWLREQGRQPNLLVGHSLGGAAVLAAAGKIPECKAVATIGAPFDPAHVSHQFRDHIDVIEKEGRAMVNLGGRPFCISKSFLDDLASQQQVDRIAHLGRALLVMHAPNDTFVGVDNAREIFVTAKHPKSFVSLDTADHLLNREADAQYAAGVLAAWASRYLPAEAAEAKQPSEGPVAEHLVRVSERGTGKYANSVTTAKHHFLADEPVSVGGTDTGMTPYQLLRAALGSCTTITIRMYADRKKMPLTRVSVDLLHDKIHAQDCAECETTSGKIDRIERIIRLEGPLSEEQRASLLSIADRCPVHRTLHGEISIVTTLADT